MGTNYYIRRKISDKKLKEIKKLVNEEDIYNGKLQEALESEEFKEIHLGKSSCGWQFLFNHNNGKYYNKTKKSIDTFIRNELNKGSVFINEYGEIEDWDNFYDKPDGTKGSFWDFVDSKKEGFDYEKYQNNALEEYSEWCKLGRTKFLEKYPQKKSYIECFGPPSRPYIVRDYCETFSEDGNNLRFAYSTEFS